MSFEFNKKLGLYNNSFEHDNCGIGLITNIKGHKSHKIVEDSLEILKNLEHRGGVGVDENSGDGAGILIQIPHKFFKKVCKNENINLPNAGDYAVGMLFISPDKEIRDKSILKLKKIIQNENLNLLGFRDVPINPNSIGYIAKNSMPYIIQVFIQKNDEIKTNAEFEKKLYIILKKAEKEIRYSDKDNDEYFYINSLSSKTIVYKGMLKPEQLENFYLDMLDVDLESAIALVHSRFSTNTFPSWERAHPNRYIIHNGEINTIRGNLNWAKAKESLITKDDLNMESLEEILPIINEDGSDSSMLDNYIHLLTISLEGKSLAKAVIRTIPQAWENSQTINENQKAFYEYNSLIEEAWEGPAGIGFTDGRFVGINLDRNGLRPARYYITKDNNLILASEVGVVNIDEASIIKKDRLKSGEILLIDIEEGKIIENNEIKDEIASEFPYKKWLENNLVHIKDLEESNLTNSINLPLLTMQKIFGYQLEDVEDILLGIIKSKEDPITAMGNDAPLAIFSKRNQLLYNYFKQLFAQVTNPPIDSIREKNAISTLMYLGSSVSILNPNEENCKKIKLETPILDEKNFYKIKNIFKKEFKIFNVDIIYNKNEKMEDAIEKIYNNVLNQVKKGANIIILSDKNVDENNLPIPALLASSGLHHFLIKNKLRMKTSIVLESGEPREVHHFATLLGYGVNAIYPYLAFDTIKDIVKNNKIENINYEKANSIYINTITKGIVKVMSKMGICTFKSYYGAQIFEALGISQEVVDKFFTNTVTRIGGLKLEHIERESRERHFSAFDEKSKSEPLKLAGIYKWEKNGEYHKFSPSAIRLLQSAVRKGDYEIYKQYAKLIDEHNEEFSTIRSMLDIKIKSKPIDINEVEPIESIVKRFKTGAMSYGSLSKEAHECIAIAMNRLGGKSNSGEGGEEEERFLIDENFDTKISKIKQVASGRFGVTINYLNNAEEIQIKISQGAKPGEGGHLPEQKVYPWIAKARHSTSGVSLISPPPHHDIYSIEDLAQLITDLKNANRNAKISVKLVSGSGVGTIAVGVAKSKADIILISGYDGGTGAAARTSVMHAGLPWEIGLSETHQVLTLNGLRSKVTLETDGKLLTGRDVLIATMLGAQEFGFATLPLVAIGCVMARICNLNTCPVGIATQDPNLRKRFKGKPEHIENLMKFIAQDLREWLAKLGVRTIDELVGKTENLTVKESDFWKAKTVDIKPILFKQQIFDNSCNFEAKKQNHNLENTIDFKDFLNTCNSAIEFGKKVELKRKVLNTNRNVGTILSSEIAKIKGSEGLPNDTINITLKGSAGQSFGAFLIKGVTLELVGDSNDFIGKGLSGGKIIVKCPKECVNILPQESIIVGNVAFFGATSGEGYVNGVAGERFCVRNSGANVVVEGVGEYGLEYMTGGIVTILGNVGANFATGMSGGVSYVFDEEKLIYDNCNQDLVTIESLSKKDESILKSMIENHIFYTDSFKAKKIIESWNTSKLDFVKVIPKVYKEVTEKIEDFVNQGFSYQEAELKAFESLF